MKNRDDWCTCQGIRHVHRNGKVYYSLDGIRTLHYDFEDVQHLRDPVFDADDDQVYYVLDKPNCVYDICKGDCDYCYKLWKLIKTNKGE